MPLPSRHSAISLPFYYSRTSCVTDFRAGENQWLDIRPPKGSVPHRRQKSRFKMDTAIPQYGEQFVAELKRALVTYRVLCFFSLLAAFAQTDSNFVSVGGTIETHGIPSDSLVNLNQPPSSFPSLWRNAGCSRFYGCCPSCFASSLLPRKLPTR